MGDMSELRDAMIIAARDWCRERDMAYKSFAEATFIHAMMADFVLHMTGAEAPELRYVEREPQRQSGMDGLREAWAKEIADEEKFEVVEVQCLCVHAIEGFDGVHHDHRCKQYVEVSDDER